MGKKGRELAAVIDIGSNELRLKIAQRGKDKLKYLESLTYGLSLGRDTFDTGKISFEKSDKVCDVIKNFLTVAAGYGITDVREVRVAATTAVREATNREYILDQIKIKTNTSVKVYDDMEEKLQIYRFMTYLLDDEFKKSALMVYNGSGNLGISMIENGRIPYVQNIKTGSLRISENFYEVQEYSSEFHRVVDEYLQSFTDALNHELPEHITHFIASGHEMSVIAALCGCKTDKLIQRIPRNGLEALYNELKTKTIERISEDYGISLEKSDLLLPAMVVYHNLMQMTECTEIIFPTVFLSDSLLFQVLYPDEAEALMKEYNKNVLCSARMLAGKYHIHEGHYKLVEKFAVKIFDKMKKIHGLGSREKVLLQTAAILHDAGKFINMSHHYMHSYNIVRGSDVVGLSGLEHKIVASLCYYHSRVTPGMSDDEYAAFRPSERVLVSKLTAILRIADALDRGHLQKFEEIDVRISADNLTVVVSTDKNTDLEQWAFNDKARFFEEVFGIKAVFKKKKVI